MLTSTLRRELGSSARTPLQLTRALTLVAAAAFALAACHDDPTGPAQPRDSVRTPQLDATPTQGGVEPTHLGIAPGGGPDLIPQGAPNGSPLSGRYIVVLKDNVLDAAGAATRLVAAHGGTVRFAYTSALKGFAAKLSDQAVAALQRDPSVAYVEPDRVVRASTTQYMDIVGQPWGLDRIDERTAVATWSGTYTYFATGQGVRAYIIDTGLQANHPEFGTRAMNVYDAFGGNGNDCNGHGTHVSGTVGGKTYGVAKGVLLRGVRVLDCTGYGSYSDIIAALDWVIRNHLNPAVANMSLGGPKSAAVNTAVANLINSGVFVSVAAGNDFGADACNYSPASTPAAFTTAASTWFDLSAIFTNGGPCVDAYAPGERIKSAWIGSTTNTIDGTSMASPHVAGVAALVKQRFPTYSPAQITSWIKTNATANVIYNPLPNTPNRVLYKGTL
jgi:subtilisin family serine protease